MCRRQHEFPGLVVLEFGRSHGLQPVKVVDHETQIPVYFSDPWGHALEVTTYDHKHVHKALQ
jgi:hypothetical protein